MSVKKEDAMNRHLDTQSPFDTGDLTHGMIESYLTRGRHLQAVFVAGLLSGVWRMIKAGCLGGAKILVEICDKLRRPWVVPPVSFRGQGSQKIFCRYKQRKRPADTGQTCM